MFLQSCRFISLFMIALLSANEFVMAQMPKNDSVRLFYFLEVGNELDSADFGLGSTEKIRDTDGNGFGASYLLKRGKNLDLEVEFGYSSTLYKGQLEDNVEVSFSPQSGSGYEALSSSTNVTYDYDLQFKNPYVGVNFSIAFIRFGGGRLFQTSSGDVKIKAEGTEVVSASYTARNQFYYHAGVIFWLDELFISFNLRSFEAPTLEIDSCNESALGTIVCNRIRSSASNRNLRTTMFNGGIIQLGASF